MMGSKAMRVLRAFGGYATGAIIYPAGVHRDYLVGRHLIAPATAAEAKAAEAQAAAYAKSISAAPVDRQIKGAVAKTPAGEGRRAARRRRAQLEL